MKIKVFCIFIILFFCGCSISKKNSEILMVDISNYSSDELEKFTNENGLKLIINEIYSDEYSVNSFTNQSISVGENISEYDTLTVDKVIGTKEDEEIYLKDLYSKNDVNELGRIPVMMYHGIHNLKNSDTQYIGGNVDIDGYQRTAEAFRNDLEFYYKNNYRMIRLFDYINGSIDVPIGKSPIVLTFDDGLQNNFNVLGLDSDGNLIIDPNCAVGILEDFKKKYPDYNVTATFFVNESLFNQSEYNEKILNWLVDNQYDIGNHSATHPDFTKITIDETNRQIGSIYSLLDSIIPNKYVNIVALPFGSPYNTSHQNYKYILNCEYNGKQYNTLSTLRVGWESDYSPFSSLFDKTFIKRIRAYDNNGDEFDISANFNFLLNNKYVSDGNKEQITIKEADKGKLAENLNLSIFMY